MIFHLLKDVVAPSPTKDLAILTTRAFETPRVRKKIIDNLRRRRLKVWSGLFYPSEPHYRDDRLAAIVWCWNASEGMRRYG